MALPFIDLDARPRLKIFEFALGETAIGWILLDLKVHIAGDLIGDALFHQFVDQCDDVGHGIRRLRLLQRTVDAEFIHIFIVGVDKLGGNCLPGHSQFIGPLDNFVIDICEILYEVDGVPGIFQISPDDVEHERAAGMTQMAIVVDRYSTHVHAHSLRSQRMKWFLLAGQRIVDRYHLAITTPDLVDASANETIRNNRWPKRAPARSRYRIGGNSRATGPNARPSSRRYTPRDNTRVLIR